MAIIDWIEAKDHATLTANKDGKHEWSAPYILTSDDALDDALTCVEFMESIGRGLSTTFRYGSRADATAWCKTIAPTRIANSVEYWQVICSYGPLDEEDDEKTDEDGNPTKDPLEWRYDISCGTQYVQTPVWQAWNVDPFPRPAATTGSGYTRPAGVLGPVTNSAGIVLDPPLMRETPETVLRVSGNVPAFAAVWLYRYAGAINQWRVEWSPTLLRSYGFTVDTWEPNYVLCAGATASYQIANDIRYWQFSYEFRLRAPLSDINPQDGFLETVLDRGLTRGLRGGDPDGRGGTISASDLKDGMAEATAIRDMDGSRVPEMVLLNGAGQPLSKILPLFQSGVYFRWRVHPYADFRALPLKIFT